MMENSVIDINDILSDSLMPASLLLIDNTNKFSDQKDYLINNITANTKYDGTFDNAYSTMGFHRYLDLPTNF